MRQQGARLMKVWLKPQGLLFVALKLGGWCRSDNLEMLMTREQMREQPQYYIKTLSADEAAADRPERLLSNFPHPYPSIRDLQREVIRWDQGCCAVHLDTISRERRQQSWAGCNLCAAMMLHNAQECGGQQGFQCDPSRGLLTEHATQIHSTYIIYLEGSVGMPRIRSGACV